MIYFPFLLLSIQDESERSFMLELYEENETLMLTKARQMVRHEADVQDVLHDACISLIKNIHTLKSLNKSALRRYIIITVENAAIDLLRKRKHHNCYQFVASDDILRAIPDESISVDEVLIGAGEQRQLKQAIICLNRRDQWILSMKYDEQLTHQEIAKRLGVKKESICVILNRIHKRLRKIIEENKNE